MFETKFWNLEKQIKAFVASGFKRSKFTTAIYEAMHVDSGRFIAHFDKDGFYKARFETREGLTETLNSLNTIKPKGRLFDTYEVKRLLRAIPEMHKSYEQRWRYQDTVFQYKNSRCGVLYDSSTKFDSVTNIFNCDAYLGKSSGIVKGIIEMTHAPLLVNSDSIAYDWILNLDGQGQRVSKERLVIFVHTGSEYKTNGGYIGASEKRLKQAQAKLKGLGYKTKYFGSIKAAQKYVETLKVVKAGA